jgi:hypothetical protein
VDAQRLDDLRADLEDGVVPSNSSPWKRTEPVILAFLGSSPMTAIEVTDLPDPDSPTMPSVSPRRTS